MTATNTSSVCAPLDSALDSLDTAIQSGGLAASLVADLVGISDMRDLVRATESVASSFPECASAVQESVAASLSATLKALSGDMKGASKDVAKVASHSAELNKVGAVLGAAFMVGLQFIPAGKMAKVAVHSLGGSLGKLLFKKAMAEGLEKVAIKAASSGLEKALIMGERDVNKLSGVMIENIARASKDVFQNIAERDVYEVLTELSRKHCTKKSLSKVLTKKIGMDPQEAIKLSEELIGGNVRRSFTSLKAKAQLQDTLIRSMQESFERELKAHLEKGTMQSMLQDEISKVCKNVRTKGHRVDAVLERDLKEKSESILYNGIKKGADEGIELGVKKAFRRFELERHMISLREFIRENKAGSFSARSVHGEKLIESARGSFNRQFRNNDNTWHEPDWKERLEKLAEVQGFGEVSKASSKA